MSKIVLFRASSKQSVELIFKALHIVFAANKRKNGVNNMGLVFPDLKNGETGLVVGVINVEESSDILSSKGVAELISRSKVKLIGVVTPDHKNEAVAFVRDRKHERGAPSKLRTLYQTSGSKDAYLKHNIRRYFNGLGEDKAWISMSSRSTDSTFSVIVGKVPATDKNQSCEMVFDTYGLSTYRNPVFINCPDMGELKL